MLINANKSKQIECVKNEIFNHEKAKYKKSLNLYILKMQEINYDNIKCDAI